MFLYWTRLWDGSSEKKQWVISVELCCGVKRGKKKGVRDVNRLEALNKAKLPEPVKQLSFGCKLCDK